MRISMRLAGLCFAALILAGVPGPLAADEAPVPACPVPEESLAPAPDAEAPIEELLAIDPASERIASLPGCASYCMAARRDCSQSCLAWPHSGEAVFSCGPDGAGGCEHTCVCCEFPDCNGP